MKVASKRKIRRLPEREAELRELVAKGLSRQAVADAMGVARTRIDKWLKRLGLSTRQPARETCRRCGRPRSEQRRHKGAICDPCIRIASHYRIPAESRDRGTSAQFPGHAERLATYKARAAAGLGLFDGVPVPESQLEEAS